MSHCEHKCNYAKPQGAFNANRVHLQHTGIFYSLSPYLQHPHSLQLQMRSSHLLTRKLSACFKPRALTVVFITWM